MSIRTRLSMYVTIWEQEKLLPVVINALEKPNTSIYECSNRILAATAVIPTITRYFTYTIEPTKKCLQKLYGIRIFFQKFSLFFCQLIDKSYII